jgi:hypothetical protein
MLVGPNVNDSKAKKMQRFGSSPPPQKSEGKVRRALKVAVPVAAVAVKDTNELLFVFVFVSMALCLVVSSHVVNKFCDHCHDSQISEKQIPASR